MPTEDQLESRRKLKEFVEAASGTISKLRKAGSTWFTGDEAKGWIEQGRALEEIKDSLGYRLILHVLDRQIESARSKLEVGTENDTELRGILKGLRFTRDFIVTTERNAEIATGMLSGRDVDVARDTTTFIKNATVRN